MTEADLSRFLQAGTDPDVADSYAALAQRAAEESFGFEEEIAFVDVETTGLDPARSQLIEVAAVVARGPEVLERYETLIDPGVPVPRETTHLTGITTEMLSGMPSPERAVERLAQVIGGRDIVAHNVRFDRSFLEHVGESAGVRFAGQWLCSLELARIALPRMRSHRLQDLAIAFDLGAADHRAMADTEAVFGLWRIALCALSDLSPEVVTTAATIGRSVPWSLRPLLAHMAAGRPSAGVDLRTLRETKVRRVSRRELPDAMEIELEAPAAEEVIEQFCDGGAVARMYETYEPRPEQLQMTEAVRSAFEEGRHLAVEAGTGVGKSVAYLVPAVAFSRTNDVTVGVSTKTNALMDQLVHVELPALRREMGEDFEYVALKGYSHYPCLRKLDRYLASLEEGGGSLPTAASLVAWVSQSTWGDLGQINLHWTRQLRSAVIASGQECTKKRCRFYPDLCYLHGLRRRAACANVVVTNHALLFSNVMADGGILPPIRHWVVDEAHSAEEVARDQLSLSADHGALQTLLRGLGGKSGTPLAGLRAQVADIDDEAEASEAREAADKVRDEAQTALTISESLFAYVKELIGDGQTEYDRAQLRVTPHVRDLATWGRVQSTGASLSRHLAGLVEHGLRLLTLHEEAGLKGGDDRADLTGQLGGVASQLTGLSAVLDGSDPDLVYSAAGDRRPDAVAESLVAQVIDVGEVLADRFFPEVRSVVFTSATMATGDDFGHFERSVGLGRLESGSHETLRLDSSYDFERQMAAFAVADAPDPKAVGYLPRMGELLTEIHRAMGGSVLTLFTNRRDLTTLYGQVGEKLEEEGLRLVGQVPGESTKRIRDEFVGEESASLFATKSFWEGFDAKGDTLRCVVVVRLPFAHPGDPLLEELRERDPATWWSDHYLPRAVLELKQAAGRLIRSSTDEGCLVIADPRIASGRGYGKRFLEALPVSSVTVAPAEEVLSKLSERFGA